MARRATRRKSLSAARGAVLTWIGIVAIAAGVGWIWWRGALPEPAAESGSRPATPRPRAASETAGTPRIRDTARTRPAPIPEAPDWDALEIAPRRNGSWSSLTRKTGAQTSTPPATNAGTVSQFAAGPRLPPETERIVRAQLAMAQRGISSGSIDGVPGSQTRAAIRAFQEASRLPVTGELDAATESLLEPRAGLWRTMEVRSEDLARLRPVPPSWLGKSTRESLDYETALELVAERSQSHPRLIRLLNPGVDWTSIRAGTRVWVPDAARPPVSTKAAHVRIRLGERILRAYDGRHQLLAHYPCSIARQVAKRPVGQLRVIEVVPNPNYSFNPEIFPESEEARTLGRKLIIAPGPNNPVGTAWIGLDRPGYGIHGTPEPEAVGRTESRGCFRLANWNAEHLLELVWIGMPVHVEP